jgi:uncharacterized protein YdeI (BOF family)
MKYVIVALVMLLALPTTTIAQQNYKSPKEACMQSVQDVKGAYADKDIGEKASVEVAKLIEISEHLCEQGNFAYAKDLLALARGMLATE